jgi:hypothetical protein
MSMDDFKNIFNQTYQCVRPTTVTTALEIDDGTAAVCKVEAGKELTLTGSQQKSSTGLYRSECKVDDKSGWITVRIEKQGPTLQPTSEYKAFCALAEKALSKAFEFMAKTLQSLNGKMKQGGNIKEGSLKTAREEMAKLVETINKANKDVSELKKKFAEAKKEYQVKEAKEKSAHVDARNAKEAAQFVDGVRKEVAKLEEAVQAVTDAGAAIKDLNGDDLQKYATPASTLEKVQTLTDAAAAALKEVRETLKVQTKAATEAGQSGGALLAKKELQALQMKVDMLGKSPVGTLYAVKGKVTRIVDPKLDSVAAAIREHAQTKKLSGEQLFEKLQQDDKVPEGAFVKMVASLKADGEKISGEIAKLVSQNLGATGSIGITKDRFLQYVVLYYKVVRGIAFTDTKDIKNTKTIRKAEEGEFLEVLEGPIEDEATGMTRVRVKSVAGPETEGWVTVAGSRGTPFLTRSSRPGEKRKAPRVGDTVKERIEVI